MAILNTVAQFGRYRLRTRLAQSVACDVWLAELDGAPIGTPSIVLKKLRAEFAQQDGVADAFALRATQAQSLTHENIGKVLDVIRDAQDVAYTREYLDGKTLRQLIHAVSEAGNALPIWFAIHVARCICLSLEYSHALLETCRPEHPVFHLNLNAENVFLTYQGQIKVTDFGLSHVPLLSPTALLAEASSRVATGSTTHTVVPSINELTHADLEGVGRVLYELLTGIEPTRPGDEPIDFVPPSHHAPWVNAEVDLILRKSLSPSHPNRFQTATELRRTLEEYLTSRRHDVSASHIAGLVTVLFSNECRDSSPPTIRFNEKAIQLAHLRSRRTTPPDVPIQGGFEHSAPTRPGLSMPPSALVTRPTLPSPAVEAAPPAFAAGPPTSSYGQGLPPSSSNVDSRASNPDERRNPFHHDWDLALKRAREQSQLAPRSSGTFQASKPSTPPPPLDPLEQAVIEFEKGLELRQRGELVAAMTAWEKALELDPQHRVCRANLNLLKKKLGIP